MSRIKISSRAKKNGKPVLIIYWFANITIELITNYNCVDYDFIRVDPFVGYKQDITIYAKRRG